MGAEEPKNIPYSGAKEIKSPLSRPVATTERTPPRLRRLSIENCSNTKVTNHLEDRKGVKSPLPSRRAKRLSLEGPKPCENGEHTKGDVTMEAHQLKNPRSPVSSYQNRAGKVDGRTSIPQVQLLQTPDKGSSRNEIQIISVDSRTNGKSSHIRKSLRTIGKLINGSEKRYDKHLLCLFQSTMMKLCICLFIEKTFWYHRKENIPIDPRSPLGVSNNFSGIKSPHTSNAKTLRRQSLTGVMPSGPERSRRSSIGGNPIENNGKKDLTISYTILFTLFLWNRIDIEAFAFTGVNGARNAKTPPPMRSPTKIGKQWA